MKFFFAILPLILGSSSCSDQAVTKQSTVPEPRTVAEFARAGNRIVETYHGNHVVPLDYGQGPYRPYYGPGYQPPYPYQPPYRPPQVDYGPGYGFDPYYPGYPYPYPSNYPPNRAPLYRSYVPVVYREIVPVNVPGEHPHKELPHHEHSTGHKHSHLIVQPVGSVKPVPHYVEDSLVVGIQTEKRIPSVASVSDNQERSSGEVLVSETTVQQGVVVPVAVPGVVSTLEETNPSESNFGEPNNRRRLKLPSRKHDRLPNLISKLVRPKDEGSPSDVDTSKQGTNVEPVVVSNYNQPIVDGQTTQVVDQVLTENQTGNSKVSNNEVPLQVSGNVTPVVAVPVELVPVVPVTSPVIVSHDQPPQLQQPQLQPQPQPALAPQSGDQAIKQA